MHDSPAPYLHWVSDEEVMSCPSKGDNSNSSGHVKSSLIPRSIIFLIFLTVVGDMRNGCNVAEFC